MAEGFFIKIKMKKVLLLIAIILTLGSQAQSSLKIYGITSNTAALSPTLLVANQILQLNSKPEDVKKYHIDIENTSTFNSNKYLIKRYDIQVATGAIPNFCFAGGCYSTDVVVSPDTLKLNATQKASDLNPTIPNSTLDADLTEMNESIGKSIIKYSFYNALNKSDSIQITFSYNGAIVGIKENQKTLASLSLFPNPANDNAVLKISSNKEQNTQMSIYTVMGSLVDKQSITLNTGENDIKLNVKNYPSGVYFVSINDGNATVTKRLVVSR